MQPNVIKIILFSHKHQRGKNVEN